MKRQYIPENPCVLSFSREKWVSFNTRQPDLKTGRMNEVKHPVLFRLVFFLLLPVLQCMTLLVGFLIGFDSKHWELIVTLLGWVALAALFAYFIRGGDLFRWEIAPTSDDGAYFEDNADVSQCKNQSVGRRDA